ncbi:MAG TPA: HAD-IIIA family hydrolase [Verrucomicrobiales bacterium]|nr:HAD-IIIA family hydrolase [Verrucomicrobiales bacterium]
MRTGVFIERDGILNRTRLIRGQARPPRTPSELELNYEAKDAITRLKQAGLLIIVTTNQPGISDGSISYRDLDEIHQQMQSFFDLDDILVCPHDESEYCPCHKPRPGMFTEAAWSWNLNLDQSYVISDKWQDSEAAHNLGLTSLMIKNPRIGTGHHDFVLKNIHQAVEKLLVLNKAKTRLAAGKAVI